MPFERFHIDGKEFAITTPNKSYEVPYRTELSKFLLERYGNRISAELTIPILLDCYDFFTRSFSKVVEGIKDRMFYFFVFNLHEQSSELSYLRSTKKIELPVSKEYFGQYRRILKLILQESLFSEITENIQPSSEWMKYTIGKLEELIFLGTFALDMVNIISEQKFTGGSIQIDFPNGLYQISNTSEWKGFFHLFFNNFEEQIDSSIYSEKVQEKFDSVLREEFNIDLQELSAILGDVSERLYNQIPPSFCTVSELIGIFSETSESPHIENFILGLTLDRTSVAKTRTGIYSPYNGDRLLHRPLLRMDIDNTPCILFSRFSFLECMNTLFQNQLTYGKLPKEWERIAFIKKAKKDLVKLHKDILEDPVEETLSANGIIYERNVKTLKADNHYHNHSINDSPGEIDFIFVIGSIIYIADCKNLTKRYEMHGYYQDLKKFEPYAKKMREKIDFMLTNLDKLERHLRILTGDITLDISSFEIEGIFIVNTPTLYCTNSKFKIYSFHNLKLLLKGKDIYKDVITVPDDEETEIAWPYIDNYNNHLNKKKSIITSHPTQKKFDIDK